MLNQHRMVLAGNLHVIRGAARLLTQGGELKPAHTRRTGDHGDRPLVDLDDRGFTGRPTGQRFEVLAKPLCRVGVVGDVPQIGAIERPEPVVGFGIEVNDFEVLFNQPNSRQKSTSLEAVFVEVRGRNVRRRDKGHAAGE